MANRNAMVRTVTSGLTGLLFAAALLTSTLFAQAITSVQNPASNILAGLPNYGIAQGSIFVIYGSGLGPAAISIAPTLPFGTLLSGTSVTITAGGQNFSAFMVYTLAGQVAAVMPSGVPVGSATVKVTFNGSTGAAFNTTVVASNFGISTVNQTGGGAAVITDANFAVITNANSAKPSSTYTLWGTGLGAKAASDNNVSAGALTVPGLQVYVGGTLAATSYVGRSSGVGLDQINFTVPAGLSGCAISLVVQTNNIVSNTTSLPVAANGGTCSDPVNPANAAITAALAKGSVAVGSVALAQTNISLSVAGQTFAQSANAGSASFIRYTPSQYGLTMSTASYGNCTVTVITGAPGATASGATGLDAGSAITVTPPSGSNTSLTTTGGVAKGFYTGSPSALPAGAYKITGPGGADVGAFSVDLTLPPALVWSNQTAIAGSPIVRANPLKITWTGGDPNSYTIIAGISTLGTTTTSVQFTCIAQTSALQFTVPSSALLALPASTVTGGSPNGVLFVGSTTIPVPFTATGLDSAYAIGSSVAFSTVNYQ